MGPVLVFIWAELAVKSWEIFPGNKSANWSPLLASPSLCKPHRLRVAVSVPVLFPHLLLLLGCILPRCEFLKCAELFPGLLGRCVSPRAGPAFPAGSTALQLPAPAWLPMALSPPHQPHISKLTHTQGRVFCFVFTTEFQPWVRNHASENKGHLPFLSPLHGYLVFPLWIFSSSYPGVCWCRTCIHLSTKTILMTSMSKKWRKIFICSCILSSGIKVFSLQQENYNHNQKKKKVKIENYICVKGFNDRKCSF